MGPSPTRSGNRSAAAPAHAISGRSPRATRQRSLSDPWERGRPRPPEGREQGPLPRAWLTLLPPAELAGRMTPERFGPQPNPEEEEVTERGRDPSRSRRAAGPRSAPAHRGPGPPPFDGGARRRRRSAGVREGTGAALARLRERASLGPRARPAGG